MRVKFMILNFMLLLSELFPHFFIRLHKEALDKFCNRELAIDDFQRSSVFQLPYHLGRTNLYIHFQDFWITKNLIKAQKMV